MSEKLTTISETLYVPMAGRIYASHHFPHIIADNKVLMLEEKIAKYADIFKGQSEYTLMASAVRSMNMDAHVKQFLAQNPEGVIVNLGCGLETTYYRCDNGNATWFELDLPEVIALREELLGKEERDICLPYSMFDEKWMDIVTEKAQGNAVCCIASGLFYYFQKSEVVGLLRKLQRIPKLQMVFDTVNSKGMKRMSGYMKQLGHEEAAMFFYVDDATELALEISEQVKVIEESDYYSKVKNRKGMKPMTRISMAVSDKFHMVKMICLQLNKEGEKCQCR